jgi:hypothetical protein
VDLESVKRLGQFLPRLGPSNLRSAALRHADVAASLLPKRSEDERRILSEWPSMHDRECIETKREPRLSERASNFDTHDLVFASRPLKRVGERTRERRRAEQWRAAIAEWKRDPAAAAQRTRNLHHRQSRDDLAALVDENKSETMKAVAVGDY